MSTTSVNFDALKKYSRELESAQAAVRQIECVLSNIMYCLYRLQCVIILNVLIK